MAEAQQSPAETGGPERPLSPHLQIYRWTIPMALSIVHRVTGAALYVGTLLLLWWLLATAAGPDAYATAQIVMGSFLGRLVLFGFSWALIYHLLNGIRHLVWDTGRGFEIKTAVASGWAVVILSLALTLATWFVGYGAMEFAK
jgi:succinate dehydrogenase / fumarate reductase cytochrome b subunit